MRWYERLLASWLIRRGWVAFKPRHRMTSESRQQLRLYMGLDEWL